MGGAVQHLWAGGGPPGPLSQAGRVSLSLYVKVVSIGRRLREPMLKSAETRVAPCLMAMECGARFPDVFVDEMFLIRPSIRCNLA